MLLSYTIVDFHLFYDEAVDIQIWAPSTRSQCKVCDTQVTVKACGPLVNISCFYVGSTFLTIYIGIVDKFTCSIIAKMSTKHKEKMCISTKIHIYVQSLKRSTFPFLRSFTVRSPSVHRAFSVHSSCVHRSQFCVHRAFIVHSFAFSVQRSLAFTVHKAFIVHLAFSLHCHSELWSWKINITILERNDDKEIGVCFIFLNMWGFFN